MSGELDTWAGRVKLVEREYYAARFAIDRTLTQVKADNSLLTNGLELREIVHSAKMLEGTYIMRLFAEFESGVRLYFQRVRRRRPPSTTEKLLNSVAAKCRILHEQLKNAHRVREYRNNLVHERYLDMEPLRMKDARAYLCRYLGFLPRDW